MELEKRLEERISEFELPNGLHFVVMERHNAPIVSVHTYANVGAFDESDGQTGATSAGRRFDNESKDTLASLCNEAAGPNAVRLLSELHVTSCDGRT